MAVIITTLLLCAFTLLTCWILKNSRSVAGDRTTGLKTPPLARSKFLFGHFAEFLNKEWRPLLAKWFNMEDQVIALHVFGSRQLYLCNKPESSQQLLDMPDDLADFPNGLFGNLTVLPAELGLDPRVFMTISNNLIKGRFYTSHLNIFAREFNHMSSQISGMHYKLDLTAWLMDYIRTTAVTIFLGDKVRAHIDEILPMFEDLLGSVSFSAIAIRKVYKRFLSKVGIPIDTTPRVQQARRKLHSIVLNAIKKRIEERETKTGPEFDPLDVAIDLSPKDLDWAAYGALQTVAATINMGPSSVNTLHEILKNEALFKRIMEEQRRIVSDDSMVLTQDKVCEMKLLESCMKEVLRMHSACVGTPRIAKKDLNLGGYLVPKDALVAPVLTTVHMNDKFYDQPAEFDPDRFLQSKAHNFLGYGGGQHACSAKNWTLVMVRAAISYILRSIQSYEFLHADTKMRILGFNRVYSSVVRGVIDPIVPSREIVAPMAEPSA